MRRFGRHDISQRKWHAIKPQKHLPPSLNIHMDKDSQLIFESYLNRNKEVVEEKGKPEWLEKAEVKAELKQGQKVSDKEKGKVGLKGKKTDEDNEEDVEVTKSKPQYKGAREGKDIGAKGKNFKKIAASAGKKYGSAEAGKKVAGAALAKMRASGSRH